MAIKKIGVYYDVVKNNSFYIGKHLRTKWHVWKLQPEEFLTRSGDKIVIILSIYSPGSFKDEIFLKWYRKDFQLGWVLEDSIPLQIMGGRTEGFRGFGIKQNYTEGKWRVLVETTDGREVGRISFAIKSDPSTDLRDFSEDQY